MASSYQWFSFVTFACLWTIILTAPTTEIDVIVEDPQQAGCKYDETFYTEGQTVATKEPCLNCTCRQGALRCHLQVCPYLHDLYPPPAGCVLVERKSACCPKLHCPTATPGSNRLLRKDPTGQIAAWRVREDLRKRLMKQLNKNGTDKLGCVESGTLYAEGSAMMTSSTCQYCFCLKGKQTCVKPQCAKPILEGCTPQFRDLACCPTHYDCAISKDNVTSVVTKKKHAAVDARLRPIAGGAATASAGNGVLRENDRVIDSPHTIAAAASPQVMLNSRKPVKYFKTKRDTTQDVKIPPLLNQPSEEEVMSSTLGPDSLIDDPQPSVTEAISPAPSAPIETSDASPVEKTATSDKITEPSTNDAPPKEDHPASPSVEEVPAVQPADKSVEKSTVDDGNTIVAPPVEVENSWVGVEVPGELSSADQPAADDQPEQSKPVEQDLETPAEGREDIDDVEAEAAEKAIEVSVSSSISSVSASQSSRPVPEPSNKMNPPPPPSKVPIATGNFLPIDNKVVASFTPIAAPVSEEPLDYDYDNMELPPSLPNLEIIPFVASDAVIGLPSNLDDDERLNLGSVVEQRTPLSQIAPTADQHTKSDFCFIDGKFYSHGELITSKSNESDPCSLCRCMLGQVICEETECAPVPAGCRSVHLTNICCGKVVCEPHSGDGRNSSDPVDRVSLHDDGDLLVTVTNNTDSDKNEAENKTISSSTTPSPMLAFKVTFPPRSSSTLPPSTAATSKPTNRFTLRRTTSTTTQRTSIAPFRSKLTNKPTVNNLVGATASPTGGLRIDSCNIYGQMYRVGRIIDELSGPCVECKCTEIGVNCVNLKC